MPVLVALAEVLDTTPDHLLGFENDDQVIVSVEGTEEQRIVEEIFRELNRRDPEERRFLLEALYRLVVQPKPRIIGE